jgi:hypothetical protein
VGSSPTSGTTRAKIAGSDVYKYNELALAQLSCSVIADVQTGEVIRCSTIKNTGGVQVTTP